MATKNATATTDEIRAAIHRALPGKGDEWSTAKQVAGVVSAAYSTITEHLRAMVADGTVRTDKAGRSTVYQKVGKSPALKRDDVPTPRAAATPKRRRATVMRDVESIELPAADVEPVPDEPVDQVWMATRRKGLNYHARAAAMEGYTVCGRSMRTGSIVPVAEVRDTSPFCPVCERGVYDVRHSDINDEPAAAPSEPVTVPQPPPAANTPTGEDVGAVVAFMESARPVSAPPAEPVKATRARRDPAAREVAYATFGRGELQQAILSHLQAQPQGADLTPYEVAKALNAQPGAVGYGLVRLEVKGNATMTADKPKRYAAV